MVAGRIEDRHCPQSRYLEKLGIFRSYLAWIRSVLSIDGIAGPEDEGRVQLRYAIKYRVQGNWLRRAPRCGSIVTGHDEGKVVGVRGRGHHYRGTGWQWLKVRHLGGRDDHTKQKCDGQCQMTRVRSCFRQRKFFLKESCNDVYQRGDELYLARAFSKIKFSYPPSATWLLSGTQVSEAYMMSMVFCISARPGPS